VFDFSFFAILAMIIIDDYHHVYVVSGDSGS